MDLELSGKRALVCASSKGLGLAVAKRLYAEGCELMICSRSQNELDKAVLEISKTRK